MESAKREIIYMIKTAEEFIELRRDDDERATYDVAEKKRVPGTNIIARYA